MKQRMQARAINEVIFSNCLKVSKVILRYCQIEQSFKEERSKKILATRNCHLATKNFGPVSGWRQHKKVNFGPCQFTIATFMGVGVGEGMELSFSGS